MCGIAGFHVKNPKFVRKHEGVEKLVNELLLGIENRGKHATGFVSVTFDKKVVMDKDDKTASEFIKDRDAIPQGVQTTLLHTRYATQGKPEDHANNHPVIWKTCFAVHNGHINNDDEIFTEIDETRTAEVDSIAIPAITDFEGFADIKGAMEKLKGRMATAIIDPVKHPGELILVRGDGSPLVLVETSNFLLWASERQAIEKAWGKVLGTPPAFAKYEFVKEGTIILVDKEGNTTRQEFDVPRPFFIGFGRGTGNGRTHGQSGRTPDSTSVAHTAAGAPGGTDNAVNRCKADIATFIKAAGEARRWSKRDHYSDEDFKDVDDSTRLHWLNCYGCEDAVLWQDMKTTLAWGDVCIDCYGVTVKTIADSAAKMQDDEVDEENKWNLCAGTQVPRINATDRDVLESWAQRETLIHVEALKNVSRRVGSYYSPGVINFLLFLIIPEYRDMCGAATNRVIDELHDLYEEEFFAVQEENYQEAVEGTITYCAYGDCTNPAKSFSNDFCELHEDSKEEPKSSESGTSVELVRRVEDAADAIRRHPVLDQTNSSGEVVGKGVWGYCELHGTPFKTKIGCRTCSLLSENLDASIGVEPFAKDDVTKRHEAYVLEDGKTRSGEVKVEKTPSELPRCGTCNSFTLADGKCQVCKVVAEVTKNEDTPTCISCKKPGSVFVNRKWAGSVVFAYCESHFFRCNAKDCDTKANHYLLSGLRFCHSHVRGMSGAISDTTMQKRGASITEVKV